MRKVSYAQSMAEKPTAAQVRAAEERMRQHLIAECDKAGYPVRGFLDTTVRQVGRGGRPHPTACGSHLPQRGRPHPPLRGTFPKGEGFWRKPIDRCTYAVFLP